MTERGRKGTRVDTMAILCPQGPSHTLACVSSTCAFQVPVKLDQTFWKLAYIVYFQLCQIRALKEQPLSLITTMCEGRML